MKRYKSAVILIMMLLLCLAASLLLAVPHQGPVLAAEGGGATVQTGDNGEEQEFDTLEKAWNAAKKAQSATVRLNSDAEISSTLEVGVNEILTLDLNGHSVSLAEGQNSSVIMIMSGSLTLKSDSGEGEIKGGNSKSGGGVYVGGTLTLSGNVKITDNAGSNIYLSNNNKIKLESFNGRVGISMVTPGEFTDGDIRSGTFTADDKSYKVDGNKLKIAKLGSIKATYQESGKVFPTTKLEELKERIKVSGTNENEVDYIGTITVELSVVTAEEGPVEGAEDEAGGEPAARNALKIGENTVLVTATGEDGETAAAEVTVLAVKPDLTSIEAEYQTKENVYFDTALETLIPGLTVKGQFEDGVERTLYHESAKEQYNEEYITERYTLSGDLAVHPDGTSTITVSVGEIETTFFVNITEKVAMVGDEVFSDFQEALEQWKSNETLKLYSDQKTDTFKVEDKLILDLNGYTITASHNRAFIISEHGELSVKDDLYSGKIEGGIEVFGSLMLYGGIISRGNYENGGGVYVHSAAVFKMYSGIIKDNKVSGDGGGVYTEGCFEMSGGIIEHNQATNGGGVYIAERGKMSICSAEVSGNSAIGLEYSTYDGYGGGVYVSKGATIKISKGAKIIDNCGMKSIKNNLHLCAERCVEIGLLGEGTEIGITVDYYCTNLPFTFCEKIEENNSTTDPSAYFKSDRASLIVEYDFERNCLYCIEG